MTRDCSTPSGRALDPLAQAGELHAKVEDARAWARGYERGMFTVITDHPPARQTADTPEGTGTSCQAGSASWGRFTHLAGISLTDYRNTILSASSASREGALW